MTDELYQESFFKNSEPLSIKSRESQQLVSDASRNQANLPESQDARSQMFFFFRLLGEDIRKQFDHCPHIQLTLQKLESAYELGQLEIFLKLIDMLEGFLDVEHAAKIKKK